MLITILFEIASVNASGVRRINMSKDLTDALSKLYIKLGGETSIIQENKNVMDYIDDITSVVIPIKITTVVTGTLVAGQTELTLQNEAIKTDSFIDIYTSDGTEWISTTVTSGQIVINFEEQESDLGVKVRVS